MQTDLSFSKASPTLRLFGAEGSVRKGKLVTVFQTVYGDSHLRQRHCSLDFLIGPATFYQTNRALVETLCQAVVSSAGGDACQKRPQYPILPVSPNRPLNLLFFFLSGLPSILIAAVQPHCTDRLCRAMLF